MRLHGKSGTSNGAWRIFLPSAMQVNSSWGSRCFVANVSASHHRQVCTASPDADTGLCEDPITNIRHLGSHPSGDFPLGYVVMMAFFFEIGFRYIYSLVKSSRPDN
jgi:hypothetical protein